MNRVNNEQWLLQAYRQTRKRSTDLVEPLSEEDCQLQSMPDTSPAKWHLAHVTWFFETFVLVPRLPGYRLFHPQFEYLFNSYYYAIGEQFSRPERGVLSRPSLQEIRRYRDYVDVHLCRLLEEGTVDDDVAFTIELGIHHEQQHQELLLMDIKHAFSLNPLMPAYAHAGVSSAVAEPPAQGWTSFSPGLVDIGHSGEGFCFDNERPVHKVYVHDFRLARRPVCNRDFIEFIEDGGYRNPLLWHSDGWAYCQQQAAAHPLYWRRIDDAWYEFTLHGLQPLDPAAPVSHISFYEASAFATWCGKRLPTEFEWEVAAATDQSSPQFMSADRLHPAPPQGDTLQSMRGGCWEWTASSYAPYPGFTPFKGNAGEYNGKFMVGQYVLRGGCCLTPPDHARTTYRNFFYPHHSWPMTGMRLAEDC